MENKKKFIVLFLIKIIFCFSIKSTTAQDYRLSKDIVPLAYNIFIKPYLLSEDGNKQFTFEGEVNITFRALANDLQAVTLHKDYIEISETVLYDANNAVVDNVELSRLSYNATTDKLTVNLLSQLLVNVNYTLYFKYVGQIRDGMAGVYRASYDDGKSWYAITQMQRINARTAFPCFDEPQLKATFQMHISRSRSHQSFFNTKILSVTSNGDNRYIDHFAVSPPMSTYLVAFIVGDFQENINPDFKLILNAKFNNKSNYAYDVGLETLEAYDNYTGLPYKTLGNSIMQKAGTNKFPHNGMENWGLVIYLDTVLTHEPGYTDDWSNKEYTLTILVHETAHMWFGNSVTFKWWSYFWLNEAFARYYQYFMAHEIHPEFDLDKQFVVNQVQSIFVTDATNSTQPMTSPEETIETPLEIASKFSSIAYAKGAAIVRMWRNLMGKDNFDAAIREYLKENQLQCTVPDDLFSHLQNHWPSTPDVNLKDFFRDYTEKVGYPLLNVSYHSAFKVYRLTQKRFLLDPKDGSDAQLVYTIPITYTSNIEKNFIDLSPKFYFFNSQSEMQFAEPAPHKWMLFNIQQSNYYRVFYQSNLLENIREALMSYNYDDIHVLNRAHLVDDLFAFGRTGLMGYDEVFHFMEYLANELDYLPWHPAFNGFEIIYQRLSSQQHTQFGRLLGDLLKNVYKKLDFYPSATESVLDGYNRNKVISWLCRYRQANCHTKAQTVFNSLQSQNASPTPDFRETLYCAACRDAVFNIYSALKNMFQAENLTSEKAKILRSMGCNRHFVQFHYAFLLTDDVPQDMKAAGINAMYTQTPENVDQVFLMVNETLEVLEQKLGSWSATASVISGISNYFTTQKQLDMLNDLIETRGQLFGTSVSTLENAVTTVEKNLDWAEMRLGKLFTYIDQRNSAVSISAIAVLTSLFSAISLMRFIY